METLRPHGFLEVSLTDTYTNICDILPQAREIARLGREQMIGGESWRFLDRSLGADNIFVGWHIGELYREGTYGKIFKAFRLIVRRRADGKYEVAEEPHAVIIKQTLPPTGSAVLPVEDVTAHTSEALLHVLAWRTMLRTTTPWAIPRPYEVFGDHVATPAAGGAGAATATSVIDGWKSMSLCMSYVRGRTLYSYIEKYWKPATLTENARAFLEILAQIAYILHHLQARLRLNHRDVKVNNLMVRTRKEPVILTLGDMSVPTMFEVTLIDFGFACVGCPPPRAPNTVFQAGSWFPMGELCCKQGRDLAQLLYCIHCYFPLNNYLPPALYTVVRSWMQIPWSGGVADGFHGFTKEGRPRRVGAAGNPDYHTGIYEFLRRVDVDPVALAPVTVFRECVRLLSLTS
jgi:serine/threonine protein kinase